MTLASGGDASTLRIGSRGSELALWQARYVASRLTVPSEIVIIKTEGDRITHLSLDKVEGKGFFTKEIEAALLAREVDLAVHSFKDLPVDNPSGLTVAAVPERAPVRDLLVRRVAATDASAHFGLKHGAKVGTSSLRRKAQLLARRPDLVLVDLRGNVPTRLKKAAHGDLDGVVLAEAGITRLALLETLAGQGLDALSLPLEDLLPAAAQGALAIQIRDGDARTRAAVAVLHDEAVASAVAIERQLLARFGGGCHLPLGAYCVRDGSVWHLRARVVAPDGSESLDAEARGASAAAVVEEVHESLVSRGAERYVAT